MFTDARFQSADYIASVRVIACYNASEEKENRERTNNKKKKLLREEKPTFGKNIVSEFLAVAISYRMMSLSCSCKGKARKQSSTSHQRKKYNILLQEYSNLAPAD